MYYEARRVAATNSSILNLSEIGEGYRDFRISVEDFYESWMYYTNRENLFSNLSEMLRHWRGL